MRFTAVGTPWYVILLLLLPLSTGVGLLADDGVSVSGGAVEPLAIDKPLVAYWNFDEAFGATCLDAGGHGHDASPRRGWSAGLRRAEGPFGGAMGFSDRHMLHVPEKPDFQTVKKISFSAWTMPGEFGKYNEIFRKEDGDRRVLFAFQGEGTILSLGLNVGGYAECDATIDPDAVLDGKWHHAAATFDGRHMRVYLDGREVGSLERPGAIAAGGGTAPGCIGSSNGGECFQGRMDELRIYADALTPEEITRLHQNGREALTAMAAYAEAGEPKLDRPLVAHWNFNERGMARVIHESTQDPALRVPAGDGVGRTRGVHGNALSLSETHALRVGIGEHLKGVETISFSAWTRPSDLRGFREIFRQECPERLLFSFQENGGILSLGLNVDGYQECDAEINPAQLLDGAWHHTAATFDGRHMRVYLDGKEVGSLERSGKLATQSAAEAFIGSSSGTGEHFHGALDDVRIYKTALTAEEVASLYQGGVDSIAAVARQLQEQTEALYVPGKSFAETLAGSRRKLAESGVRLNQDLAGALLTRLKSAFPEDYENFINWAGTSPVHYLTATHGDLLKREAGRMVELLMEYKPLTEHQLAKQTPEDRKKWAEAEAIRKKYDDLVARGEAAEFSPAWIEIVLEAAPRIQFRPRVSEPVAPYRTPGTPETVDLTAEEARAALERDWLHQADRNPSPERIASEIHWTGELAGRIAAAFSGEVDFTPELQKLAELEEQAASISAPDEALYFQVREVKRAIALKNPVVDFDKMLLVDMPYPAGSEWHHESRHRLGYMAVPGARLLVLEGLSPSGKLRQLMPQPPLHGSFWRPDVSYDGRKVLFSTAGSTTSTRSTCPTATSSSPPRGATRTSAACRRPTPTCSPGAMPTARTSTSSRATTSRTTSPR